MPDPVRRRWSAAEISSLRKLVQKHPAAQIATQLGRSRSATRFEGASPNSRRAKPPGRRPWTGRL